jgi:hypothetical protein
MRRVVTRADKLFGQNDHATEIFATRICNTKDQNTRNVFEYLEHRRLANVFRSWKNIKAHLKLKRMKEREVQEILASVRYRRTLQKWFLRTEATKRRRFCLKTIKRNYSLLIKRAVWDRLIWRKALSIDISMTIGHLENLLRTKNYVDSFQTIKCFAQSKKLACTNFKRQSTIAVGNLLTQIHENRLKRYFLKYKWIVKS